MRVACVRPSLAGQASSSVPLAPVGGRSTGLLPVADEESELQLRAPPSPPPARRDPSILKGSGSVRRRQQQTPAPAPALPPAVTFNVECEGSDDEGQITFSARGRAPRPASLTVQRASPPPAARSLSAEDPTRAAAASPLRVNKSAGALRSIGSAERLSRLKDKLVSRGGGGSDERSPERFSDDESAPLVAGARDRWREPLASAELSPRSDSTGDGSAFDLLPDDKGARGAARGGGGGLARADSDSSLGNMVEPYNLRLLAARLWRQDALDAPPWPGPDTDSAV